MLGKYFEIIKEQENTIIQLRKEMKDHRKVHKTLKKEFNDITYRFQNISNKVNHKEGDYRMFHQEYEEKLSKYEKDKLQYDEKIHDLLDIIKTQKLEIGEFKIKQKLTDSERKTLNKNIVNLQGSLIEERKINEEFREQLEILNELNRKFDETSKVVQNLQNELEIEKNKNSELASANNVNSH
jgi:chromosome segregation ATPase